MYSIKVDAVTLLQALSDKTRLRILKILVENPKEESCLCEFADSLEEPEYNVSRHLKILRQAGLLNSKKEGRWVYHSLIRDRRLEPFYRLVHEIEDVDQMFQEDLIRFRDEIKKRKSGRCSKEGSQFERSKKDTRRSSNL